MRFALVLLTLLTTFCAGAQERWDLQRAVDYAIANNISVKAADIQRRFSTLQLTQAEWAKYPTLNFGGNAGLRFGLSENPTTGVLESRNFFNSGFNLQSGVTLFNWFAQRYNTAAARLTVEADRAQVTKIQNDVALNVAVAYLQVLLAQEQSRIAGVQIAQTAAQLEATQKRVKAGALPELNAVELEAQLARDSANYYAALGTIETNRLQMKALLALDAAAPFELDTPPIDRIPLLSLGELQPEAVYAEALQNLPQQVVQKLRLQAAEQNVKAARTALYPTISAFGSIGSNFVNIAVPQGFVPTAPKPTGATVTVGGTTLPVLAPGFEVTSLGVVPYGRQLRNNFGQNVGISLQVPILNGRQARTGWERSKLNVLQSQLDIDGANLTLKQDIYTAHTNAITALQRFNAAQKSVTASERAYEFAQKRYNLALLSTYDLLNTQNGLQRSRIELLSAQFEYVFRMKLLEFYKGKGLKLTP